MDSFLLLCLQGETQISAFEEPEQSKERSEASFLDLSTLATSLTQAIGQREAVGAVVQSFQRRKSQLKRMLVCSLWILHEIWKGLDSCLFGRKAQARKTAIRVVGPSHYHAQPWQVT